MLGRISEAGPFADATGRPCAWSASAPTRRGCAPGASARRCGCSTRAAARAACASTAAAPRRAADRRRRGSTTSSSSRAGCACAEARPSSPSVLVDAAARRSRWRARRRPARLALEHVTVRGSWRRGVTGSCATPGRTRRRVRDGLDRVGLARGFDLGGGAASPPTDFPEAAGDTNLAADPRFTRPRRAPAAPLPVLDAGRPAARGHGDPRGRARLCAARRRRGDGSLRRDMGALELQPPALGAVTATCSRTPARRPARRRRRHLQPGSPQWSRSGSFTFVRYGTVAGNFPFPSRRIGEALSAATPSSPRARQGNTPPRSSSVREAAPDRPRPGLGRAVALLGGYRASADAAIIEAEFRDPAGRPLGRLRSARSRPATAAARRTCSRARRRARCRRSPAPSRSRCARSPPPAATTTPTSTRSRSSRASPAPPRTADPAPGRQPPAPVLRRDLTSRRAAVDRRRRAWVRLACATASSAAARAR